MGRNTVKPRSILLTLTLLASAANEVAIELTTPEGPPKNCGTVQLTIGTAGNAEAIVRDAAVLAFSTTAAGAAIACDIVNGTAKHRVSNVFMRGFIEIMDGLQVGREGGARRAKKMVRPKFTPFCLPRTAVRHL